MATINDEDTLFYIVDGGGISARTKNEIPPADMDRRISRAYEAGFFDALDGNDDPVSGDIASFGYRRATKHGLRDFSRMSHDQILNTVWVLYQSSPVAKRMLAIKRDYILGHSCSFTTDDEGLKKIFDRFIKINKFYQLVRKFVLELSLFGELCLPAFVRESDGQIRLGYIDPIEIESVICHPENVLERWAVVCKMRTHDDAKRIYRIIREDEPVIKRNGVIQPKNPDKLVTDQQVELQLWENAFLSNNGKQAYSGSCFYASVNNVSAQPRGFSDLLQLADTLDQLDETLFALAEREALAGYFSYDVELVGADDERVAARSAMINKNPPTKKGAIRVRNDSEKWTFNYPDMKAPQSIATADALKAQATNGMGQPSHWHNLDNTATRTTADSQNNPTWKTLEHDQAIIRDFLVEIFDFVRDQAEIASAWSPSEEIDSGIAINLPEISRRDTSSASETLSRTVQALAVAQQDLRVVSRKTASKVVSKLIAELGVQYDPQEELQLIDDDSDDSSSDGIPQTVSEFLNGNGVEWPQLATPTREY